MIDYTQHPDAPRVDPEDDVFRELRDTINAALAPLPLLDDEKLVLGQACIALEVEGRYNPELLAIICRLARKS